ncbi:MAG: amidohydrolase family protein [Bryobacteraceae bacterium]
MSSRRQFLTIAIASLTVSIMADQQASRIDCQSHLFSEEFLRFLEKRTTSPRVYRKGDDRYVVVGDWCRRILPKHTDAAAKIDDMDRNGIGKAALSINDPGPELFGKESGTIAAMLNDFIAGTVRGHPDRFFGLAVLPFDNPDSTLREFERATGKLGMKGVLLYSNLAGHFPDEPQFQPMFDAAERKGIPILLHPALPVTWQATRDFDMAPMLGLMFDTTIALCRLILSGTLERHPNLKLVCPHVGGALPYLIGRVDHQATVLGRGAQHICRAPSEYLKRVYFDTVSPIGLAIQYGYDFAGPERMLYASDHPWVDPGLIVQHVTALNLPRQDEAMLFAGNARGLFGI